MGHSSFDPAFHELRPWNEGRVRGAKRPKIESTVRYLGVDVEDALEPSERTRSDPIDPTRPFDR